MTAGPHWRINCTGSYQPTQLTKECLGTRLTIPNSNTKQAWSLYHLHCCSYSGPSKAVCDSSCTIHSFLSFFKEGTSTSLIHDALARFHNPDLIAVYYNYNYNTELTHSSTIIMS
jgi:hypothetical protein